MGAGSQWLWGTRPLACVCPLLPRLPLLEPPPPRPGTGRSAWPLPAVVCPTERRDWEPWPYCHPWHFSIRLSCLCVCRGVSCRLVLVCRTRILCPSSLPGPNPAMAGPDHRARQQRRQGWGPHAATRRVRQHVGDALQLPAERQPPAAPPHAPGERGACRAPSHGQRGPREGWPRPGPWAQ